MFQDLIWPIICVILMMGGWAYFGNKVENEVYKGRINPVVGILLIILLFVFFGEAFGRWIIQPW